MVQHEGGGVEGNILSKSDVPGGAYTYGPGKSGTGSTAAGPHAVVSAGGNSYAYDANGNLLSVTDVQSSVVTRTVEWTSFNKPSYIHAGALGTADGSRFFHGPDRARVIQSRIDGIYARTQVHVGGLFEHVTDTNPGRPAENVHYIAAAGGTVAIYKVRLDANPATDEMLYVHRDHLGSVDTLTDASGEVAESLAFGPWGARRDAGDWDGPATFAAPPPGIVPLGDAPDTTPRGFTGHEHLDNVTLVHMNGRIYDPVIGRFLSADPFVQAPGSTQAFNRYTYVNNNPLSYTDPSGFFFKKLFRAAKKILKNKVVRIAAAVAFAYFGAPILAAELGFAGGALSIAKGAIGGFGAGLIGSGGDLRAALIGGLTGAAFGAVGNYFDGLALENIGPFDAKVAYLSSTQQFAKVVAHGAVGGAASKVSGGSFQDGFLGAGVAEFGAGAIGAIRGPGIIQVVAAAVVGGTASALGGGKFANGAATAAFGRLFNHQDVRRLLFGQPAAASQFIDRYTDSRFVRSLDAIGMPTIITRHGHVGPDLVALAVNESLYAEFAVEFEVRAVGQMRPVTEISYRLDVDGQIVSGTGLAQNLSPQFTVDRIVTEAVGRRFVGFIGAAHVDSSKIRPASALSNMSQLR